jgi:hypothetical protein
MQVNDVMGADFPITSTHKIDHIAREIRVLLYNGDADLNCNFWGTQRVLEEKQWLVLEGLKWEEAARYERQNNEPEPLRSSFWHPLPMVQPSPLACGSRLCGRVSLGKESTVLDRKELRRADNFALRREPYADFVTGHLFPMDLPAQALDMLNRFTQNQSFADSILYRAEWISRAEQAPPSSQAHTRRKALALLFVCAIAGVFLAVWAKRRGRPSPRAFVAVSSGISPAPLTTRRWGYDRITAH